MITALVVLAGVIGPLAAAHRWITARVQERERVAWDNRDRPTPERRPRRFAPALHVRTERDLSRGYGRNRSLASRGAARTREEAERRAGVAAETRDGVSISYVDPDRPEWAAELKRQWEQINAAGREPIEIVNGCGGLIEYVPGDLVHPADAGHVIRPDPTFVVDEARRIPRGRSETYTK